MKGLKRPENVYLEKFDINVTPYLTIEQEKKICELMLAEDDLFNRQVVLLFGVLAACTDIAEDEEVDYDTVVASGLWNDILSLVYDYVIEIKEKVHIYESMDFALTRLCDKMTNELDNLAKAMPTESKLTELAEKFLNQSEKQEDGNDK